MTITFRERDGVCIEYEVRGYGTDEVPYVNSISTLKEAVAIGRNYPDVYGDGSATHILRRCSKLHPPGGEFHHMSCYTHRFRVFSDGRIEPTIFYKRPWVTTRDQRSNFSYSLQGYRSRNTRTQLADLIHAAQELGFTLAADKIAEMLRADKNWAQDHPANPALFIEKLTNGGFLA
jgi:hypothetical protein